jgi:hypothetical protein
MPDFTKGNINRESGDTGDRLQSRREWLQKRLGLADGTLPPDLIARASAQKRAMEKQAAEMRALKFAAAPPIDAYWTPLGPSAVAHGQADDHPVVSGRVTALAVGPGGNRVYLGAANGGTWYSENSGASWTPIDQYALPPQTAKLSHTKADSLSVGAIAVRFGAGAAQDEIYVGTGEAPGSSTQFFGVGIKHSPSGGTAPAWTLEATNLAGEGVFRIVIDPEKPEVVFAATTSGLFMRPQSGPVANWTQITNFDQAPAGGAAFSDIVVSGTGANKVYFAANAGGSVYRSTDAASDPGGGNWKAVGGFTAKGRVALAASEGTVLPRVYALDQSATLYRIENLPTGSFASIPGVPPKIFKPGDTDQSDYDIVVAVDPSNSAIVYVAGAAIVLGLFFKEWNLAIYKGGVTLGVYHPVLIGEGIHPDGHVIAFATNADGTHDASNVWVGCDGGVFQSSKSGASGSFQARNEGLAITQLTFLAQHPQTDQVLVAGSQDQGTLRFRGDQVAYEEPEGDGGGGAYDPNNGYRVMRQNTETSLYTSTDGANSWSKIKFPPTSSDKAKTESGSTNSYAPIAAVAVDANNTLAAFGTNRLWITSDWGDNWVTVPSNSNPYDGPDAKILTQDALDGSVNAIAWASPTRIYVASDNSVFRFDLNGGNWTPNPPAALPVTGLPANRTINAIAVEDAAAGKIYVALGGGNVDHVWYFDPAVGSWVNADLTQGMLDVPCNAIVVDPAHTEQIYLGTVVGVFKGVKTGANWIWNSFGTQLPECAVTDLAIHPQTRVLRAATQGLGAWEIPLDVPKLADPDLYLRANSADSGRVPRPSFLHGLPDPNHKGTTLDLVSSPDIKLVRSSALGKPDTTPDFFGFASLRGFATDLNTFDSLGTNQLFVEVHNRGKTPVDGAKVRVLVLLADGSAALPALPADFATRLQNGDTSAWLTPGWHFADAANPYRTLTGALDVRTPQVVQYNVNFPSLGLPQDTVAAAAFVTTDADPFTSTETDANALIVPDKHVAVRTLSVGIDWRIVLGFVLVAVGVGVAIALAEKK